MKTSNNYTVGDSSRLLLVEGQQPNHHRNLVQSSQRTHECRSALNRNKIRYQASAKRLRNNIYEDQRMNLQSSAQDVRLSHF